MAMTTKKSRSFSERQSADTSLSFKTNDEDITSKENDASIFEKKILKIALVVLTISVLITFCLFFLLRPSGGKTNFLLLGIAGENHAGSDLTDTIFFASVENTSGRTTVLSIPRDIWIAPLRTKLNSVYHYEGPKKSKELIGQVVGQPIDYIVVADFDIFKKIIDVLGKIEVNVERTFDDYKYPIAGKENDLCDGDPEYKCRYEHIHFDAGLQNMDGEIALKYVRSRNAAGEEGTDFARSLRQQRILLAIKDKILTPEFFVDPKRPIELFKIASQNIKTDVSKDQYFNLFKTAVRFRTKNLKMELLDERFLTNPKTSPKYDNQWVLIPKTGNWEEIHNFVSLLVRSL